MIESKKISITTNNIECFSATVFGNSKDLVVLLHGFPADSGLWHKLVPLLAHDFSVVVPDLPGIGESSLPLQQLNIDQMGDAVVALLQNLSVEKAIIVGHSMGGYIGLSILERHPEFVAGLSLVHSTAMTDSDEKIANRQKAITLIENGGRELFIKANIASLFAAWVSNDQKNIVDWQIAQSLKVGEATLVAMYKAMMQRPDRQHILVNAQQPIQWIIGAEDSIIPMKIALQQSLLSQVTFVSIYNNCAHMSMLENPDALATDVKAFCLHCFG